MKNKFRVADNPLEYFDGNLESIPTYNQMKKQMSIFTYGYLYRDQCASGIDFKNIDFRPDDLFISDNISTCTIPELRYLCYQHKEVFNNFPLTKYKINEKQLENLQIYNIGYDIYRYKNQYYAIYITNKKNKIYSIDITCFYCPSTPILNDLYDFFKLSNIKRDLPNTKGHVYFVLQDKDGYKLVEGSDYKTKSKKINFDYYNDDFRPEYNNIISSLNDKEKYGLYFLHGIPGTGKTSFIRHLTNKVKNRKMIFIPSSFAHVLSEPAFLTFIAKDCKNAILILEDCEKMLTDRLINNSNSVPNLLNISDGLLGDMLNISIICTFNTGKENIDDALLRKGRAMFNYEFKELSLDKAQKINSAITKPMSLADCLMFEDKSLIKEKTKIGFGQNK